MRRLILFIPVVLLFCSCAASPLAQTGLYAAPQTGESEALLAEIRERNETIEQHPEWVSRATKDFMIRSLEDMSEAEYANYRAYLDEGAMYVIVHPAYYVFFQGRDPFYAGTNAVDAFIGERAYSTTARFLQEQERATRDFLEVTSTRKRLVVLVLPGNYRDYEGFVYRELPDEFARYINGVTNGSDSVLYVFSEKPNKGSLPAKTKERLTKFINAVQPTTILVGGGYVGRCESDFYKQLSGSTTSGEVMIAGELSVLSPEDVRRLDLANYLRDGKLDVAVMQQAVIAKKKNGEDGRKGILWNYRNYLNNRS